MCFFVSVLVVGYVETVRLPASRAAIKGFNVTSREKSEKVKMFASLTLNIFIYIYIYIFTTISLFFCILIKRCFTPFTQLVSSNKGLFLTCFVSKLKKNAKKC